MVTCAYHHPVSLESCFHRYSKTQPARQEWQHSYLTELALHRHIDKKKRPSSISDIHITEKLSALSSAVVLKFSETLQKPRALGHKDWSPSPLTDTLYLLVVESLAYLNLVSCDTVM